MQYKILTHQDAMIRSDGNWNKYIDMRLKRCRQALGRHWKFFKFSNVSVDLKVRIAKTLILSHLAYGEEIVCLTAAQAKQIDNMQARVISTILQLPLRNKHDAARFITGQIRPSTTRTTRQVCNLQRIRHLRDTRIREIYDDGAWDKKPFIFQQYKETENAMKAKRRLTNVTEQELMEAITEKPSVQRKRAIKDLNGEAKKVSVTHELRQNHGELLEGFTHTHTHPMWKRPSPELARYANWLLGTTCVKQDMMRRGLHDASNQDDLCRLCDEKVEETRQHLLTDCAGTITERSEFLRALEGISTAKLHEMQMLEVGRQWTWILAAGTIRERNPYPVAQNRILPARSPVIAGASVAPVMDKDNDVECLRAYNEYREILEDLEPSHIRVYTDGSFAPKENKTGYGFSVLHRENGSSKKIHEHSKGLGSASVQQAELTAAHEALRYLLTAEVTEARLPVHIFTDSKYTLHASTSPALRRKHFYLVQEIHNMSYRLKEAGCEVWMHYVPSHIEKTAAGLKFTGNHYADKLADKGRHMSKVTDETDFLNTVRERILSSTIVLVDRIDKRIQLLNTESDGPSGSPDDLNACVHADRNSVQDGVP